MSTNWDPTCVLEKNKNTLGSELFDLQYVTANLQQVDIPCPAIMFDLSRTAHSICYYVQHQNGTENY